MAEYNLDDLPGHIRDRIRVIEGHWVWFGADKGNKYEMKGAIVYKGKNTSPHRVVFHLLTGFDLDSSLQVNHKKECSISLCCHPNCLYAGTQQDNMKDRTYTGRRLSLPKCDGCGGEWSIDNRGYKYCQPCHNKYKREQRRRASND